MTAILSPQDVLRRERTLSSHDDNSVNYTSQHSASTDWKAKYLEVADMLAETRAELDDFQHSSKELEEELERELERTEKSQEELRTKAAKAELDRDEWKSKFMSLQTTHNTTTTSLHRELDTVRKEHQQLKVQLRELEMGNDDLERTERAVSSSLAEAETKYSRVLEEKILLEQELLDKASLEEECQRLKDELRDANLENTILKDQLGTANARPSTSRSQAHLINPSTVVSRSGPALESLLSVGPPDLLLSDLSPPEAPTSIDIDTEEPFPCEAQNASVGGSMLLEPQSRDRQIVLPADTARSAQSSLGSTLHRTATPSRIPPRSPVSRPVVTLRTSSASTTNAPKSRGVQMVSEMRARVRNLEQKIHTRVPRLRLGSSVAGGPSGIPVPGGSPSLGVSKTSAHATQDTVQPRANLSASGLLRRRSVDNAGERKRAGPADSSGWVLIMEDSDVASPSPGVSQQKDKEQQRRRASSPSSGLNTLGPSPHLDGSIAPLFHSTMAPGSRRPPSRLSTTTDGRTSTSTTSTVSSIPTPSSRPATPTFLPAPSSSVHHLKRSTSGLPQSKRSSLGATIATSTTPTQPFPDGLRRERPISVPAGRSVPSIPHNESFLSPNVTVRSPRPTAPPTASANALGQSRIGRPAPLRSGRKSVDGDSLSDTDGLTNKRARSGSTTLLTGRY